MAKFNTSDTRTRAHSPVTSHVAASGLTHQGGAGWERDAKSSLYLFAVSNFVTEHSFYEAAHDRDARFADLVAQVVATGDIDWLTRFTAWLRNDANMRSSALVVALEGARMVRDNPDLHLSGVHLLVNAAMARADEPGEALAYWTSKYGRKLPASVKRGVALAATRLYTQRAFIKYDGANHAWQFSDVIDLTHPVPSDPTQADLFRHILNARVRKNRTPAQMARKLVKYGPVQVPQSLDVIREYEAWTDATPQQRRGYLVSGRDLPAGVTWENLSTDIEGGMDAVAWNAVIPNMGYMALLRNLRNFIQAGVGSVTLQSVAARIASIDEVAKSRQLPLRFASAYKAIESNLVFAYPLELAMHYSLSAVPSLPGRSLILVDTSGSMFDRLSAHGVMQRYEVAAIFGTALAMRADRADLIQFGTDSHRVNFTGNDSLLPILNQFYDLGGTYTAEAVRRWYDKHDRVIIITDEQIAGSWGGNPLEQVPDNVPCYTWNLGGYHYGHGPSGSVPNRHTFGGLSDASFGLIPMLESGRDSGWPWDD